MSPEGLALRRFKAPTGANELFVFLELRKGKS